MPAEPPPLPTRSTPSLPYAMPVAGERWSPWPLSIACTAYAVLLTVGAVALGGRLTEIFKDFKVDLPAVTQVAISASWLLVDDWLWVPLVIAAFGVPFVVVPRVPPPASPESRRRVARTTRYLFFLLVLGTVVLAAVVVVGPAIALMSAVSAPSKR